MNVSNHPHFPRLFRCVFAIIVLTFGVTVFHGAVALADAPATQPASDAISYVTVTVHVVDRQNNPLEGENVKLVPNPPKEKKPSPSQDSPAAPKDNADMPKVEPIATGVTDATGTVVFPHIPTGAYVVQVSGEKGKGHIKLNVHHKDTSTTVVATIKTPKTAPATEP